ncbi:MAG: cobalamin-dependent protein [Planctomycetota bacterium]
MKASLSPRDLAQAVGVSESSLKRWADSGRLNVSRTAGGHRRIAVNEAVRFIRDAELSVVRPDLLGLPTADTPRAVRGPTEASEALTELLLAGDTQAATGMMVRLYLGGAPLTELFDGPIRHAMHHIGELWHHSAEGVFIEHRATDGAIAVVNQLRAIAGFPGADPESTQRPCAVGGAPAGDAYTIASLMCATVAAEAGWNAVNLGANTPLDSLRHAVERHQPKLVWLSGSVPEAWPGREALAEFAQDLARHGARLVVGGQALPESDADPAGAHRLESMAQFAELLREQARDANAA